jgi:argininosuccinate synthase
MTRIVFACTDSTEWGGASQRDHAAPVPELIDGAVGWLCGKYDEVVTLMLDFGQGRELEALRDRALTAGAVRAHVLDVAAEFAARFVLPALKAGALCFDGRPGGPGLERLIAAQKLVEVAAIEQTTIVGHGYGGGERRLAAAVQTLNPQLTIVTVPAAALRTATGLPEAAPSPVLRRAEPAFVDLTFVHGVPTAINGVNMPLPDLVSTLNMLAGTQTNLVNRREAPAARLLHDAHRGLQGSADNGGADRQAIAAQYVELIDSGTWFSTTRPPLDETVDRLEQSVSGTVRLRLVGDESEIVAITPLDTMLQTDSR